MAGMAASWHFDNLITLYPASLHIPTSPQRRTRGESSVTRHRRSAVIGPGAVITATGTHGHYVVAPVPDPLLPFS